MSAATHPSITPRDRMSFALFLTAALHAGLILGLGFSFEPLPAPSPTIEITLAQHNDVETPDQADYLAQANQQGSGDLDEVAETTTTEAADFHQDEPVETLQTRERATPEQQADAARATLTSAAAAEQSASREQAVDGEETPLPPSDYHDLAQAIASLDARLADEQQTNAKAPRIRRLTSVSAKRAEDAYYLASWTRKVEAVGNLNYPEEARSNKLYGKLRLLVVITADGALQEVRVLDPSGHKVLDDAAVRIVRLAAPYAPFPPEMAKSTDVLEIIRTWQFRKNRYSSS